jgi:hypothetical protein
MEGRGESTGDDAGHSNAEKRLEKDVGGGMNFFVRGIPHSLICGRLHLIPHLHNKIKKIK